MQVTYVAVYKVLGVNALLGDQDVDLVHLPESNATARLTVDPDADCFHIDQRAALGTQMLKSILGQAGEGDLPSRLAAEQRKAKDRRNRDQGAGVFLVLEGEVEVSDLIFKHRADFDDFAYCFDAFSNDEIREKFRNVTNGILATIGMGIADNKDLRIKKMGDVSYLQEPETEKTIYSFTLSAGTVVASVSGPLQEQTVEFVRIHAETLCTDQLMSKVTNLLIQSLETATDELRSFIVAWAALEIFVNSLFKAKYEEEWLKFLISGAPTSSQKYFERLRDVMKDKHRLSDKFLVIASVLNEGSAEEDSKEFERLKGIRDKLFHGDEAAPLQVEQTQSLLRKYLKLHLERMT